jgi:hypothetical protein
MPNLNSIIKGLKADPGLRADNPNKQIARGVNAAEKLNATLLKAIDVTNVNDDGRLTAGDMMKISDVVYTSNAFFRSFMLGHGNDAGRTTGFHWVQNDGATLFFRVATLSIRLRMQSITMGFRSGTGVITTKTAMTTKLRSMWRAG